MLPSITYIINEKLNIIQSRSSNTFQGLKNTIYEYMINIIDVNIYDRE